jgi:O-antigen ligase
VLLFREFTLMIFYFWLIWVLPMTQHPIWGGRVGPLTVFEYLGLASLAYATLHILRNKQAPAFLQMPQVCALFPFYLWATLSMLGSGGSISPGNSPFVAYTSSFLLFLITLAVIDSMSRFRRIVLVMIGSYAFASLYVLREWQTEHARWSSFRPGWIAGDSNYFSCAALISVFPALYLATSSRVLWQRLFCAACLLAICPALTLCASRGAFVGLAVAAIHSIWHTRRRLRTLFLLSILVIPASLLLPISPLRRLVNPEVAERTSEGAHLEAWRAGLRMIEAHPVTGVGVGRFKEEMRAYAAPGLDVDTIGHNMFIEIAAEMGIPSALLFFSIFVFDFRGLAKLRKAPQASRFAKQMAAALSASLVALLVSGLFISAEYQKTTWFALALAASLCSPALFRAALRRPLDSRAHLPRSADLAVARN